MGQCGTGGTLPVQGATGATPAIDSEGSSTLPPRRGLKCLALMASHWGRSSFPDSPEPGVRRPDKKTLYSSDRGSAFKIQMLASGFQGAGEIITAGT